MELGLLALLAVGLGIGIFTGVGGDDVNRIEGTEGFDQPLNGTNQDDVILGMGGFDLIQGLDGDDMIQNDGGAGWFYGGAGDDTLDARGGDAGVFMFGGTGADVLEGGDFRDVLYGQGWETSNAAYDYASFYADDGAPDTLRGGGGIDELHFSDGDTVSGGEDRDFFYAHDIVGTLGSANPSTITDFDPDEELLTLFDTDGTTPVLPDRNDISWTVDGENVEVRYLGEVVVIVQGVAGTFGSANLGLAAPEPV